MVTSITLTDEVAVKLRQKKEDIVAQSKNFSLTYSDVLKKLLEAQQ